MFMSIQWFTDHGAGSSPLSTSASPFPLPLPLIPHSLSKHLYLPIPYFPYTPAFVESLSTHHVHVYAIGDRPGVLEVVLHTLPERVWDLVEADELLHPHDVGVVACRARVQALDDGRNVTEDARVHQCCKWEYGLNSCASGNNRLSWALSSCVSGNNRLSWALNSCASGNNRLSWALNSCASGNNRLSWALNSSVLLPHENTFAFVSI
jgi:hypothetical protein